MHNKVDEISRSSLVWLLVAQILSLLPLFFYLAPWLSLIWISITVWRIQIHRGVWSFPGFIVKASLAAMGVIGLFLSYSGIAGVEPMVSFLVTAFSLKFIEVQKRADALQVVYIAFICVAAQLLFYQEIFMAIYALICAAFLILSLEGIYRTRKTQWLKQIQQGFIIVFQALPIMVVLFLVMPRLGQLWNIPLPSNQSTTGFSDSMSPGDFSSLIRSNEPAFRVTFHNQNTESPLPQDQLPPTSQLYWRGLVLDFFDGRTWNIKSQHRSSQVNHQSADQPHSDWDLLYEEVDPIRYTIMLEPHFQKWLFVLMAPTKATSTYADLNFVNQFLLKSKTVVTGLTRYEVDSISDYVATRSLLPDERDAYLQIPKNTNLQSIALAEEFKQSGLNENEIIDRMLTMYRESFVYTLRPPLLRQHTVDEFLFSTQRGFCEHYASSFVFVMRAAGIPARVVVGYQGGEYNQSGNYLLVRQSDAHAWAEVWIRGKGWQRIDPTAAVSPSRIESGLDDALSQDDLQLVGGQWIKSNLQWLYQMQLQLDRINYQWNKWVLSYDNDDQNGLLNSILGGTDIWRIALFMLATTGFCLLVYLAYFSLRKKKKFSRIEEKYYHQFLKKLDKIGLKTEIGETPKQFAARVVAEHPHYKNHVDLITRLYVAIAYEEKHEFMQDFKRQISQFKCKTNG